MPRSAPMRDLVVANHVQEHYELLEPVSCRLIRHGFNDHYFVRTGQGPFVFRIYSLNKPHITTDADFRFELDLLDFLASNHVSVSRPVRQRDGQVLGRIELDGSRACALLTFAEGRVVQDPSESQAAALGRTLAMIHALTETFTSEFPRYSLDLTFLLDRPLQVITELAGGQLLEPHRSRLEQIRNDIESLGRSAGVYGVVHGDFHSPNVHFAEDDRLTVFDFDFCGYGFRAYDLTSAFLSLMKNDNGQPPKAQAELGGGAWGSFLEAYSQIRQPADPELSAIRSFIPLRGLWDIGNTLSRELSEGPEDGREALQLAVPGLVQHVLELMPDNSADAKIRG